VYEICYEDSRIPQLTQTNINHWKPLRSKCRQALSPRWRRNHNVPSTAVSVLSGDKAIPTTTEK